MGSILFYLMLFAAVAVLSGLRRSTPPSNWPRRGWPQEPGWPRQSGWPPAPPEGEPRRPPRGARPSDDDFAGGAPSPEFDPGAPSNEFDSAMPAGEGMQGPVDLEGLQGTYDLEGRQGALDLEGRQGAEDPEGHSLEGRSQEGRSLEAADPALTPTAAVGGPGVEAAHAAGAWFKNREDLVRGVVLAEVLGPCRARQPRRPMAMRRI